MPYLLVQLVCSYARRFANKRLLSPLATVLELISFVEPFEASGYSAAMVFASHSYDTLDAYGAHEGAPTGYDRVHTEQEERTGGSGYDQGGDIGGEMELSRGGISQYWVSSARVNQHERSIASSQ